MKRYELSSKSYLTPKMPVLIRLDGIAFHTLTRNFIRPFDDTLGKSMRETMKYLCQSIQGCVLGYTQSDEITLILVDYKNIYSVAWFDYEIQKLCSVAASKATYAFRKFFEDNIESSETTYQQKRLYKEAIKDGAFFDARCFNVPVDDVTNCLLWRQQDAERNSIQMIAHTYFKQEEVHGLNNNQLQDKIWKETGINWNNIETWKKRGSCCKKFEKEIKAVDKKTGKEIIVKRMNWEIDTEIPIFSKNRNYIEEVICI